MSVILILILASLVMATIFLAGFIWSVCSGQYEDTTTPSLRVLMEENATASSAREKVQPLSLTQARSRWERERPSDALDSSTARPAISDARDLQNLSTIPPIPAGEGRGEGEPRENQPRPFASDRNQPAN